MLLSLRVGLQSQAMGVMLVGVGETFVFRLMLRRSAQSGLAHMDKAVLDVGAILNRWMGGVFVVSGVNWSINRGFERTSLHKVALRSLLHLDLD